MAHARRSLIFLLVFAAVAQAAMSEREFHFTVFSDRPIAGLAFASRAGAAPQPLGFYPTARSPRYDYRGPLPLKFIDAKTGATLAVAEVPPGIGEVLLLFSAAKSGLANGPKFQVAVLDDSAARHGAGGLAIINFSGLALSGIVNGKEIAVAAGLNPTLAVGSSATISLRTRVRSRDFQAYADTVMMKKGERALLILFPPFYQGSHEVQSRLLVDEPRVGETAR